MFTGLQLYVINIQVFTNYCMSFASRSSAIMSFECSLLQLCLCIQVFINYVLCIKGFQQFFYLHAGLQIFSNYVFYITDLLSQVSNYRDPCITGIHIQLLWPLHHWYPYPTIVTLASLVSISNYCALYLIGIQLNVLFMTGFNYLALCITGIKLLCPFHHWYPTIVPFPSLVSNYSALSITGIQLLCPFHHWYPTIVLFPSLVSNYCALYLFITGFRLLSPLDHGHPTIVSLTSQISNYRVLCITGIQLSCSLPHRHPTINSFASQVFTFQLSCPLASEDMDTAHGHSSYPGHEDPLNVAQPGVHGLQGGGNLVDGHHQETEHHRVHETQPHPPYLKERNFKGTVAWGGKGKHPSYQSKTAMNQSIWVCKAVCLIDKKP